MDDPTPLSLPSTLPYPITVTRILAQPPHQIKRGAPLVEYAFTSSASRIVLSRSIKPGESIGSAKENDMVGTWDSGIEGSLIRWEEWLKAGTLLERKHAGKAVMYVHQACSHPVQLHGMCGVCGADLSENDYLTKPTEPAGTQAGPSRYGTGFEMSHDAYGVTVSKNEAQRLEVQSKTALLSARKLSLIVDLDQTIIHTTVDPTIGDWLAEIRETNSLDNTESDFDGQSDMKAENQSTTPPTSPSDRAKGKARAKEQNPNAKALKDVAEFQLPEDLPPGVRPRRGPGGKRGRLERCYYTKPRPSLTRFLESMSEKYEMHVYTMGTRSYADAIIEVIDPDGRYFGGRILSRDESGSFSSKSLKRLFPTDQSMVVVIDDRADVWADVPNLVKVVPYDFFLGIGDINSTFLPPASKEPTSPALPSSPTFATSTPPPATPESEGIAAQNKMMNDVSESRPLEKMQKELEKLEEAQQESQIAVGGNMETNVPPDDPLAKGSEGSASPPITPPRAKKPLLKAEDYELDRVTTILSEIHAVFFGAYDNRVDRDADATLPLQCDVLLIIPDIKSRVLDGCTLLFSGLIPRHIPPPQSDFWLLSEAFGAIPVSDIGPGVTHCVVAGPGTEKANRAERMGIPVVTAGWFWESLKYWKKEAEGRWLAKPDGSTDASSGIDLLDIEQSDRGAEPVPDVGVPLEGGVDHQMSESMTMPEVAPKDSGEEGLDFTGGGWDESLDAELRDLFDGQSDTGDWESESQADRTISRPATPSLPGTPSKKRVRYADDEHLPLESFQDPSPADPSASPPKKRAKPLLLHAPEDGVIPEANRFEWKGKGKEKLLAERATAAAHTEGDGRDDARKEVEGFSDEEEQSADEDDGDDDLFARMLAEGLDAEEGE